MKINIIASTKTNFIEKKDEFDLLSGKIAGVCYMPGTFDEILKEENVKTEKRISLTKNNGHHSVYDHEYFSLYIDGISKMLSMILNNEKQYTTSEKSARYTKIVLEGKSSELYYKWLEIFKNKITIEYQEKYPAFFTQSKIEKLAQENARYLNSVFTPTSMIYTTSYRQINYIYKFLNDFVQNAEDNQFNILLKNEIKNFCGEIEKSIEYLDVSLQNDGKNRKMSFFSNNNQEEYFGDVYCVKYQASFAALAQAQRHRTLSYSAELPEVCAFYVPEILKSDENLVQEWLSDLNSVKDQFPQALLLNVCEMGNLDNFILKVIERKCSCVQLEINQIVNFEIEKYFSSLKQKNHSRANELENCLKGSRCTFPGFVCQSPCGFSEGITEKRKI